MDRFFASSLMAFYLKSQREAYLLRGAEPRAKHHALLVSPILLPRHAGQILFRLGGCFGKSEGGEKAMLREDFKRRWRDLREPLLNLVPNLTGAELDEIGDDYDGLVQKIEEKTGQSRGEVETTLAEIFTTAPETAES
jgi:hypothetical protein